jgi:hypothetical protein
MKRLALFIVAIGGLTAVASWLHYGYDYVPFPVFFALHATLFLGAIVAVALTADWAMR